MRPIVPGCVNEEYNQLYNSLKEATNAGGNVGMAATDAFRLAQSHYLKDQEYALSPLKYLAALAGENQTGEITGIRNLSGKVKRQLSHLRREAADIISALEKLADVALREDRREYHSLARSCIQFYRREEQLLYPAAILVGELIEAKAELEGRKLGQLHA